jgi:hypothetical protein
MPDIRKYLQPHVRPAASRRLFLPTSHGDPRRKTVAILGVNRGDEAWSMGGTARTGISAARRSINLQALAAGTTSNRALLARLVFISAGLEFFNAVQSSCQALDRRQLLRVPGDGRPAHDWRPWVFSKTMLSRPGSAAISPLSGLMRSDGTPVAEGRILDHGLSMHTRVTSRCTLTFEPY